MTKFESDFPFQWDCSIISAVHHPQGSVQTIPDYSLNPLFKWVSLHNVLLCTLMFFRHMHIYASCMRSLILKGVLTGHKSVTGILPNNPTMLPPFSFFMNFHLNLSKSCSGVIIRLERSPSCN